MAPSPKHRFWRIVIRAIASAIHDFGHENVEFPPEIRFAIWSVITGDSPHIIAYVEFNKQVRLNSPVLRNLFSSGNSAEECQAEYVPVTDREKAGRDSVPDRQRAEFDRLPGEIIGPFQAGVWIKPRN